MTECNCALQEAASKKSKPTGKSSGAGTATKSGAKGRAQKAQPPAHKAASLGLGQGRKSGGAAQVGNPQPIPRPALREVPAIQAAASPQVRRARRISVTHQATMLDHRFKATGRFESSACKTVDLVADVK